MMYVGLGLIALVYFGKSSGSEMKKPTQEDDDEKEDPYKDHMNDPDNSEYDIPDGFVLTYNGNLMKLSNLEDIDDLADPSDYYN